LNSMYKKSAITGVRATDHRQASPCDDRGRGGAKAFSSESSGIAPCAKAKAGQVLSPKASSSSAGYRLSAQDLFNSMFKPPAVQVVARAADHRQASLSNDTASFIAELRRSGRCQPCSPSSNTTVTKKSQLETQPEPAPYTDNSVSSAQALSNASVIVSDSKRIYRVKPVPSPIRNYVDNASSESSSSSRFESDLDSESEPESESDSCGPQAELADKLNWESGSESHDSDDDSDDDDSDRDDDDSDDDDRDDDDDTNDVASDAVSGCASYTDDDDDDSDSSCGDDDSETESDGDSSNDSGSGSTAEDSDADESAGKAPSRDSESDSKYHAKIDFGVRTSRSSGEKLKKSSLNCPMVQGLEALEAPCHHMCSCDQKCTQRVDWRDVMKERLAFFGPHDKPAPKDKERAKKIAAILWERGFTVKNKLVVRVGEQNVCPTGLLRIIGLLSSPDIVKAPGQARRLIQSRQQGCSREVALATKYVRLASNERHSTKKGIAKAHIELIANYYSDTLPKVIAKSKKLYTRQLPFRTIRDMWRHWKLECRIKNKPSASEKTFARAYNEMHDDGLVQLLGGKSGFNTCSICNELLTMKTKCARARTKDILGYDIIQKVHKLHLKQQQRERQHADYQINMAKTLYENGFPALFYVCLDGMTNETTKAPRVSKDRTHALNKMECRNMGARIVCGPIDEYIAICTPDYIPGGANVLIECTRIAIEILAKKLSELPNGAVPLPFKAGINFDNCPENKVT
jgi:hypothetical protein